MANPEHLEILRKGVEAWNKWREKNRHIYLDLSEADLSRDNLSGVDLSGVDLSKANLSEANLSGVDLSGAYLSIADFSEANLSRANLSKADLLGANLSGANLSGCKIDESTFLFCIKNCQFGVNGIYSPQTDSAALMQMVPRGNSMQGSTPDAVMDNLKHAKKLHFASLTLVGISLLLLVLHIPTLKLPFGLTEKEVDAINFAALSVIISFGLCSLTAFFFSSALEGAKYINDRESAMKVGHFPWILSKYEHAVWRRRLSIVARTVLCFHPVVYLPFFFNLQSLFSGQWLNIVNDTGSLPTALLYLLPLFGLLLLATCIWIFITSLDFLQPILFDPQTEAKRKSYLEKMTEAIKEQTTKMDELLNVLKGNEEPAKSSDSPPEA